MAFAQFDTTSDTGHWNGLTAISSGYAMQIRPLLTKRAVGCFDENRFGDMSLSHEHYMRN
jgi:hypothetical protein